MRNPCLTPALTNGPPWHILPVPSIYLQLTRHAYEDDCGVPYVCPIALTYPWIIHPVLAYIKTHTHDLHSLLTPSGSA